MKKIILASQSPRRRELLTQAGYDFQVIPSGIEEVITKEKPDEIVEELSSQKAKDVFDIVMDKYGNNIDEYIIIGADTVVSIDGKILGKPKNHQNAYEMIKTLQGRTHQVYTGVCFVWKKDNEIKMHTFNECTEVEFYPMSHEEIMGYVDSGNGDDKAGAYGIQSQCAVYIKGIMGDYNNVVGMPIARMYQELKNID